MRGPDFSCGSFHQQLQTLRTVDLEAVDFLDYSKKKVMGGTLKPLEQLAGKWGLQKHPDAVPR